MATPNESPASSTPEKTFRSFNSEQGKNYAQVRPTYSLKLYQAILDHHTSTGGELNTLLDVGCGPGFATVGLAPHFVHAIGIDPSEGMIETARSTGGTSSTSEPIRFEISNAEELGQTLSPAIPDSSVDLITAATAAHWFDMPRFWKRAAEVLKPGGSVAIWCAGRIHISPSVPNHEAIQTFMEDYRDNFLVQYIEPGNLLAENLYVGLALPWTLKDPVQEFDESTYLRKEWNSGASGAEEGEFYAGGKISVDMKKLELVWGTSSPIVRWREAHPDDVGTERDIVKIMVNKTRQLLHEAGVEEGKEMLQADLTGVLMIAKKKA
jgi:trans-aconitate 3-methyltransferase